MHSFVSTKAEDIEDCRVQKKENSKRRKDDHNLTRKSKDKKIGVSFCYEDRELTSDLWTCAFVDCVYACGKSTKCWISSCFGFKNSSGNEKVSDPAVKSSNFTARSNVSPYAPPMITMDNDDGISYIAIGGPTGDLLEQNAQALNQISTNLSAFQVN
ncbi:hypothetical protein JHK87_006367 [Glycine soja]|nr:hypothetical protein JHK87_006367 [Glycine soja]